MNKFIGTFGSNHGYARCYTEVSAATKDEACKIMQERYQGYWSTVYPSEKDAGVGRYGLLKIEPGVCPPFERFGRYTLQSWLIERGVPFEHDDAVIQLVDLATDYWQEN